MGETRRELDRETARQLRDSLSETLTDRREFLHTAGEHREDGRYVVERRNADSAGHRKVFDKFAEIRQLYDTLPARFGAEDAGQTGLTGGRRHILVRHFAEHPAFDCELACRQPLTVEKHETTAENVAADSSPEVTPTDD